MKPSELKPGQRLMIRPSLGDDGERLAFFVRREPARGKGAPAKNFVRFPDFEGLDGPEDDGTCQMSDYHLARQGRYAEDACHVG
ncbi:MAG: hypothetical protein ABGX87_12820 [Alcanivorax sp.]